MGNSSTHLPVAGFKFAKKSIGDMTADAVHRLISVAADIALVIDKKGIIQDLLISTPEIKHVKKESWIGLKWIDVVTVESRQKVKELLSGAVEGAPGRWRQINHIRDHGTDLPVNYTAVSVGERGKIFAIGRELLGLSKLQQNLVDAQHDMELEYARFRQAQTRYRLLFQYSSEAVLIVDATSLKIREANPAASMLLDTAVDKLIGRSMISQIAAGKSAVVRRILDDVNSTGEQITATIESKKKINIKVSQFRSEQKIYYLIHLLDLDKKQKAEASSETDTALIKVVENLADGFVVTDLEGSILFANAAFLELAELVNPGQVANQHIDNWLGRPGLEMQQLFKKLLQHGYVRNFNTVLRGANGGQAEVELSSVATKDGDLPCCGFVIRRTSQNPENRGSTQGAQPRSLDQLKGLVGRVPLKDLVRDSSDMIEKLSIEAALELTGNNRASAANILGLSRQSLYSKLKRYNIKH